MARDFPAEVEVVIVGAGPAGSTLAYYLAQCGVDAITLEKAEFGRDKVCGDGLTPNAVAELLLMGVDTSRWHRNYGLRTFGGGRTIEIPWPELTSMPSYGMAVPRTVFDKTLVEHAQAHGARIEARVDVVEPIVHEKSGRAIGVRYRDLREGRDAPICEMKARVVVDAGGVAARMATKMGREKIMSRPMGVAVRTYFESPRTDDPLMESHLELWDGEPGKSELQPGYGWVFPLGDGTVNVGLGSLTPTAHPSGVDHRGLFKAWTAHTPKEWQFDKEHQRGRLAGAAIPMAFNRKPHYASGLLLIGDAGGMVSAFNGEGIAYAMRSARIAAQVLITALARESYYATEKVLYSYPREMQLELGGYHTLGRGFAHLISKPEIMRVCVQHGLGHPTLMRFVMKLLSDCYDRRDGDWMDRLITALAAIAPKS